MNMDNLIKEAQEAMSFLRKCRDDFDTSIPTGALRDAHEWLEHIVRKLSEYDYLVPANGQLVVTPEGDQGPTDSAGEQR
jgi:hypothetical protein